MAMILQKSVLTVILLASFAKVLSPLIAFPVLIDINI